MATIPLNATPSQTATCTLSGQPVRFWLRQLASGLYLDVWLAGQPLLRGALCLDRTDLIRNPASPLPGRLYFTDMQGHADPDHTGLGSRFLLRHEGPQ